ncbi:unnamed protein product [Ectocarpus sp. 13 AM-2016]
MEYIFSSSIQTVVLERDGTKHPTYMIMRKKLGKRNGMSSERGMSWPQPPEDSLRESLWEPTQRLHITTTETSELHGSRLKIPPSSPWMSCLCCGRTLWMRDVRCTMDCTRLSQKRDRFSKHARTPDTEPNCAWTPGRHN